MAKIRVRLQPLVRNINLPTVLKTAFLPGDSVERLFIATQVGEIFYIGDGGLRTFLDIRQRIIKLGHKGGEYDERGLVGLAFHPQFRTNGLFYLHYSAAGTQGPGALTEEFHPDPCNPGTLNLRWTNRETRFDHIDTVEEWMVPANGMPQKRRTLLNIRRPFFNHNGVNSLNFSPETGKLVFTTGDGGAGYDPFNLAQDDMEIAGKIIEIDVSKTTPVTNPPVVTRFNELPRPIQETLTVIAKGVRNIPGISYQRIGQQFIKYVGNVGQDFAESIFSFVQYQPIPVTRLVEATQTNTEIGQSRLINFGWRGWEGAFPTPVIKGCPGNPGSNMHTFAYYSDAVTTSERRIPPLVTYLHDDARPDKFAGTALTGVQAYMGTAIPALTGRVVFIDLARKKTSPVRGVLAYSPPRTDGKLNEYTVIETDNPFGSQPAHYVSLGTNLNHTRLYLGAYRSMSVMNLNQGTIFEILS
ncbi:glucose dehydrogenase [Neobacillus piezotolerans]|uniref:Glucose dehydrogenase n=1 Tax=Neobacillus piezotolerans TaxID=2259171 RepID=A0A3D8GSC1_9BACI|nr:PQQ-dependent sugar dehydrogenase [Neobacillus piezotolerans]RDU37237.1 glucose dehydrogenase [Neobacillus piezotolerans]